MRNKLMRFFAFVVLTFAYYGTICMNGLVLLYAGGVVWIIEKLKENRDKLRDSASEYALDEVTIYAAITMAFLAGVVFSAWLAVGYWEAMNAVTITPVVVE